MKPSFSLENSVFRYLSIQEFLTLITPYALPLTRQLVFSSQFRHTLIKKRGEFIPKRSL